MEPFKDKFCLKLHWKGTVLYNSLFMLLFKEVVSFPALIHINWFIPAAILQYSNTEAIGNPWRVQKYQQIWLLILWVLLSFHIKYLPDCCNGLNLLAIFKVWQKHPRVMPVCLQMSNLLISDGLSLLLYHLKFQVQLVICIAFRRKSLVFTVHLDVNPKKKTNQSFSDHSGIIFRTSWS